LSVSLPFSADWTKDSLEELAAHALFSLQSEDYMIKKVSLCLVSAAFSGFLLGDVINTNNPADVAAFQSGATVADFENIPGRSPQTISTYTSGDPVSPDSFVFDQISGVQFSVGGAVGTNEPALYELSDGIAGDAKSPDTVLGPVDFDFTTKFNSEGLIEIFFPTKVSKVGFWLNPSLGDVMLIAADTNFAFSHLPETTLESGKVTAGSFVGIERPTADIGGFKIEALGDSGFTIDDFTFGGSTTSTTVPEPGTLGLLGGATLFVIARRKRGNQGPRSAAPTSRR
jgi:hypothetical protein